MKGCSVQSLATARGMRSHDKCKTWFDAPYNSGGAVRLAGNLVLEANCIWKCISTERKASGIPSFAST